MEESLFFSTTLPCILWNIPFSIPRCMYAPSGISIILLLETKGVFTNVLQSFGTGRFSDLNIANNLFTELCDILLVTV